MSGTTEAVAPAEPQPAAPPGRRSVWQWLREGNPFVLTGLSLLSALVVGGLLIALTDSKTTHAMSYFFAYPWDTFIFGWEAIWDAYKALFEGAVFDPSTLSSGSFTQMMSPISETLVTATPLILVGLSVGL